MPPKSKFTKEEIVAVALDVAENDGIGALTARTLGSALGSSARPIFTVFNSMEEVMSEVIRAAKELYARYVDEGLHERLAFKGVGKAYIRFAAEHPKLFTLLFMSEAEKIPDLSSVLYVIDGSAEKILGSIVSEYGLERQAAQKLYLNMFIYTHGIAVLIATKVCEFSADEISEMLTEIFTGMLKQIKSGDEANKA
ncbi:MAG: WHG domain-containing protein [Clostridiales bacterium]|nr:WHG domain-containing protein [Clostridiales bacterium]